LQTFSFGLLNVTLVWHVCVTFGWFARWLVFYTFYVYVRYVCVTFDLRLFVVTFVTLFGYVAFVGCVYVTRLLLDLDVVDRFYTHTLCYVYVGLQFGCYAFGLHTFTFTFTTLQVYTRYVYTTHRTYTARFTTHTVHARLRLLPHNVWFLVTLDLVRLVAFATYTRRFTRVALPLPHLPHTHHALPRATARTPAATLPRAHWFATAHHAGFPFSRATTFSQVGLDIWFGWFS